MTDFQHQHPPYRILRILLLGLLVLLRVVHLDADAYARLSWSSALLTDEGFYIHNARNLVLFGHTHTDQFNNALIMPLLHLLQVAVFTLAGVGAVQARALSVVCSLLTLALFFAALRRGVGTRVAWLGLLLLGLDPVFTLYNRMALMDTPACLPLAGAFYAWTRAHTGNRQQGTEHREGVPCEDMGTGDRQQETGSQGEAAGMASRRLSSSCLSASWWLALCGLSLGAAYAVRGLAAVVVPVPLLLLLAQLWQARPTEQYRTQKSPPNSAQSPGPRAPGWIPLLAFCAGLGGALLPYLLLWYWPNHQELARVNTYYINHQLKPDSLHHLWQNIQHAFFGDDRGLSPYLFRHSPVTFALALLWIITQPQVLGVRSWVLKNASRRSSGEHSIMPEPSQTAVPDTQYLAWWLLLNWLLLAVISYAPDRYYVLFYPAMCGLAALTLSELPQRLAAIWHSRRKRALLGGFLVYHFGEAFLHHDSIGTDICLYSFTMLTLLTLAILPLNMSQWREQWSIQPGVAINLCLMVWAVVTVGWTTDWLRNLSYTQRDADHWLATHLPANSVLIGDVAPGLCLDNRFRCINVIPGLCNDQRPMERFAPAPRTIIILDGKFKEPWWRKNYPDFVAPSNQIHLFPHIIRLPVGVYDGAKDSGKGAISHLH